MIYGVGTDIVAVERLTRMHARYGDKLHARILASAEWAEYQAAADKARFLAKRFAAKEALAKALGTGLRPPVTLANAAVEHDGLGRPGFAFAPDLLAWLKARRIGRIMLSISDEAHYAVAFVVAETEP